MRKHGTSAVVAMCLACAGLVGCKNPFLVKPPANEPSPMQGVSYYLSETNGLTNAERERYYHADEGIQYLPVDLLRALNRPFVPGWAKRVEFLSDKEIGLYDQRLLAKPERFGLYPSPFEGDQLPLGISESNEPGRVPMAGLNCSTCHTTVMTYERQAHIIDGGASHFAISTFIKEMVFSLAATTVRPLERQRVYRAYKKATKARLQAADDAQDEDSIALVDAMLDDAEFASYSAAAAAFASGQSAGFAEAASRYSAHLARLSAAQATTLGPFEIANGSRPRYEDLDSYFEFYVYLLKRVAFFATQVQYAADGPDTGMGRSNPWLVVRNMLNANKKHIDLPELMGADTAVDKYGAINTSHIFNYNRQKYVFWTGVTNSMMERNLAQGVALVTDFDWNTYETTVSVRKLHEINALAEQVVAPAWPNGFPDPDLALAAQGKAVFEQHCLGCHSAIHADEARGQTLLRYCDVSTDDHYYKSQSRNFRNYSLFTEVLPAFIGRVSEEAYEREHLEGMEPELEAGRYPGEWRNPSTNAFVAKPLHGVWASAPYLHNGSVRTLRELLMPPAERPAAFWVGSIEYEPYDLGYKNEQTYYATELDTTQLGNSQLGHDFGTGLSDGQKEQLLEFLKTYVDDAPFGGPVENPVSMPCYNPDLD